MAIGWRRLREHPLAIWAVGVIATYLGLNLLGFETIATTVLLMMALAYLGTLAKPLFTLSTKPVLSYIGLAGAALAVMIMVQFVVRPWLAHRTAWQRGLQFNLDKFDQALNIAPYLKPELGYYLVVPTHFPVRDISPAYANRLAVYLEQVQGHRRDNPGYYLAIAKAWEMSDAPDRLQQIKDNLLAGMAIHNDNNGYYWAFLSSIELKLGNIAAALAAIDRAEQLNPQSRFTTDTAAYIRTAIAELEAAS